MTHRNSFARSVLLMTLVGMLLPTLSPAMDKNNPAAPWPKDSYYKDYPMFHWYPSDKATGQSVYRFGPVGIGIDLTLPAFGMKIKNIEDGSPAAATGQLKVGQEIQSINGKTLKDIDPRVILGNIITQAEATDGKVTLMIRDSASAAKPVVVQIPVLGAYSKTWPLNCPKSDKIVRGVADYLAKYGNPVGALGYDQGLLFLLSTGEDKDLEVARTWVQKCVEATKDQTKSQTIPWAIGYGAPAFCEYYLRTGDTSILPLIQQIADQTARIMYNGGWNHRTSVNFKYGHMNAAGLHCVKFLALAKECGVKVDEYTLQTSLQHFFRFAGRGNVAYGDGLPEGGFVDNGKVGGLAFSMAAAASLDPKGEDSVYAKARDICAVKSFYSTSWMLHGHTGGGIGEVWRSSAMSLMYDKKPTKFREFADNRLWYLELSRRYNGAMTVLRDTDYSKRYDDEIWGSGLAMSYTVPRKTLRMTGAPPSKFSKKYALPERAWGRPADDAFYSLAAAAPPNGKALDPDAEKLVSDASYPLLRKLKDPNVSDDVLMQYAGHPDHNVRAVAAEGIRERGRDALIPVLLKSSEPRLRETGVMVLCIDTFGMTKIPQDRITKDIVGLLAKMIADPNEALWTTQNAMVAMSLAKPELIAPSVDVLIAHLANEEWWIQRAAIMALTPLASDPKLAPKIIPAVTDIATKTTVAGVMMSVTSMVESLAKAPADVQKIASESFGYAYRQFPTRLTAKGGMDMQNAVPHLQGALASAVATFPGGFDQLFQISRQIMPDQALPYKELYFKSESKKFGPELAKIMPTIVMEDVIPEFLAVHMNEVLEQTRWATVQETPKRQPFAIGILDDLTDLYREIGINDYNWHVYGPTRDKISWQYYSYDAPDVVSSINSNSNYYIDMVLQATSKLNKSKTELDKLNTQFKTAESEAMKAQQTATQNPSPKATKDAETRKQAYEMFKQKLAAATQNYEKTLLQSNQAMLAGKLPKGLESWYSPSFSATGPGWKTGFAPFANNEGKLAPALWSCVGNFCGCGEKPATLWEKDVLLMRTTLSVPPLKPDCRYRLLLGGNIHSKCGGPVTVYINGKAVHQQGGFGGRVRSHPRGFFIDKELAEEFKKGKVLISIAAIKSPKAYLSAWLEEMKMPTIGEKEILNAQLRTPLACSEWQELQDPENRDASYDVNDGKYRFNGKFVDNARIRGAWKMVDQIDDLESFTAPRPNNPYAAADNTLALLPGGKTSNPNWVWSANTLMALDRKEALAMTLKTVKGKEYLFIECGGFSQNHPKGWQSELMVMEKK